MKVKKLPLLCLIFLTFLFLNVTAKEKIAVVGLSKGRAMLEIDGRYRVLSPGEISPEGVTLISADSEQAILEIDGQRITYGLNGILQKKPPVSPAIRDWQPPYQADMNVTNPPTAEPVRISPDEMGMYLVSGAINGHPVRFLVDTGASALALNSQLATQLGIDYQQGKKGHARTASGLVNIYEVQLDQVQVGHIVVKAVVANIIEGIYPTETLLGMSFLSQVDMQHKNEILELHPRY